jgi:hypothetical protein
MIYLTQLVYVREGREREFLEFEAVVLPLLAKHRGELLLRLRPESAALVGGSAEAPYEVHVVRFASEADLAAYSNDEVRVAVLRLKEESVRYSVTIRGTLLT